MRTTLRRGMLLTMLGCCLAGGAAADEKDVGIGIRAQGMGGAYVSLANDPSAVYWNPAGLARVKHLSLFICGAPDLVAAVFPAGPVTLAVGRASSIEHSLEQFYVSGPVWWEESIEKYSVSAGVPLGKRWTAGASLNYYKYSTVDLREDYSLEGTGIGTDAGLLFALTKHITLGATFQPETAITLEQEKGADDLKAQDKEAIVPQKAGAGASFAAGNFALGLGYRHIRKPSTPKAVIEGSPWFSRHSYSAGAEYRLFKGMLPLRLGVNWQRNIDDPVNNTVMNRTCGTGIRIKHVAVDVSYIESVESNDRVTGETEHDMGFSFGYAF